MKTSIILTEGRQELILEPETKAEHTALQVLQGEHMICAYGTTMRHMTNGPILVYDDGRGYSLTRHLEPIALRVQQMPPMPAPTLLDVADQLEVAFAELERRRRTNGAMPVLKRKDLDKMDGMDAARHLVRELVQAYDAVTVATTKTLADR